MVLAPAQPGMVSRDAAPDAPALPDSAPVGGTGRACLLRGLRDLFAARGAGDLRAASLALDACTARYGNPVPLLPNGAVAHVAVPHHKGPQDDAGDDARWREVEYAFNRLFVGPMSVPAPPYASAWLENDPRLMGEAAMDVRALYHALGYAVPGEGAIPDDHVSFELDAALALSALLDADTATGGHGAGRSFDSRPPSDDPERRMAAEDAWRWLVAEHMSAWVPRFVQRALAEPGVPPAIARGLALLLCWQEDAARACAPRPAAGRSMDAAGPASPAGASATAFHRS